MSTTITKVKNNTVTLPRALGRIWNNVDVAVTISPSADTVVLKRMRQKKERLSEIAIRNPLRKMSRQAINREIAMHRSGR